MKEQLNDPEFRTPWQVERDVAEANNVWPDSWGPHHRHFANDAIHRDGGTECDQPGTPRRVWVFDSDYLDQHERAVALQAIWVDRQSREPEWFDYNPNDNETWPMAATDYWTYMNGKVTRQEWHGPKTGWQYFAMNITHWARIEPPAAPE